MIPASGNNCKYYKFSPSEPFGTISLMLHIQAMGYFINARRIFVN